MVYSSAVPKKVICKKGFLNPFSTLEQFLSSLRQMDLSPKIGIFWTNEKPVKKFIFCFNFCFQPRYSFVTNEVSGFIKFFECFCFSHKTIFFEKCRLFRTKCLLLNLYEKSYNWVTNDYYNFWVKPTLALTPKINGRIEEEFSLLFSQVFKLFNESFADISTKI